MLVKYTNLSDEALMKRLQNRDTKAFDVIYKRYYQKLYYFILKMTRNNKDVSNDIVQDVFYKLLNSPQKFDVNKKFHSWVFTVTANECRKHFRFPVHEDIENNNQNEIPEFTIEKLDLTAFKQKIDVLLEEVNDRQKEAFILRHQENFTLQEIAEIQDCALGTIKSRLHYTTKYLADKLEIYKTLIKTSDYGRL